MSTQWLGAFRRVMLDDLGDVDWHAGRQVLLNGVLGPRERQRGKAHRKMGLAWAAVWPFAQFKHPGGGHRQGGDRLANRSALDNCMIVHQPGEAMGPLIGHP